MLKEDIIPMGLAEVGQLNPLRWQVCRKEGDIYIVVTPKFKCKDFLNEVVASYHTGLDFSVYGFHTKNTQMGLTKDLTHLPLLLTHCSEFFKQNVSEVLNKYLQEQGFPLIELIYVTDSSWLALLDKKYMETSFYMSIITLLLRCMSQPIALKDIDHCLSYIKETNRTDYAYLDLAINKKHLNTFPEKYKPYAYYYEKGEVLKEYTEVASRDGHTIHNCGVINWRI